MPDPAPLRVLIVEDSEDDAYLVERQLRLNGFNPVCRRVDSAVEMQNALKQEDYDLIVSDYLMPAFNALGAMQIYRDANVDIPFIVVSGSIGEEVAVEAMKHGVHDYLMKDNLTRLPATIERELREASMRRQRKQLSDGLAESVNDLLLGIHRQCTEVLARPASAEEMKHTLEQILRTAESGVDAISLLRLERGVHAGA